MTYEALVEKARNAAKILASFPEEEISLGAADSNQFRNVRLVEIPSATNTTSQATVMLRDMPVTVSVMGIGQLKHDFFNSLILRSSADLTQLSNIEQDIDLAAYWSPAFEELQEIRADERPFRAILRELRFMEAVLERRLIADRLETLLEDFQGDYGRSVDAESLRTFVAFLSLYPDLRKPIITAASNGNIFAEWKSEDGSRFLGLQMFPMLQVQYVAIRPNPRYPQLRKNTAGVTSVEQLFADLASYDIQSWIRAA